VISKKDMERIAQGFKYVADDPTADHSAVVKMIVEFQNAADSLNPRFDRAAFSAAIFGGGKAVINPWTGERIECGACGYDLFYDRGRSLDLFNHECQRCFHVSHTMTETGMSA
jgi:hypothetical protein